MQQKKYISSDDINRLFYQKPKKKRSFPYWQTISAGILVFIGIYFALNAPAVTQQLSYWWENDIQASTKVSLVTESPHIEPSLPLAIEASPVVKKVTTKSFDPATIQDNRIVIPRIKVNAPIIWDVSGGSDLNTDMLTALQKGVVRYPQTALPDQIGNVFLTGHSSNYWWDKGHYKTIFALLDRLVAGDTIYIKYQGTLYTYKVTNQKIVKPEDTSVLKATSSPILSLMTCTPTGTSLFRRIVTASLISPTDNLKPQLTQPKSTELNAVR